MKPDPLPDPPWWVAAWVPQVDDERSIRRFRRVIALVLIAGLLGFVLRGADGPADPFVPGARTEQAVEGDPPTTPTGATDVPEPTGTAESTPPPSIAPFDRGGAEFTASDGSVTCVCVLVADTRDERSQGLMNRTDLGGDAGMVFVFETDSTVAFTMRDTPLPLSIAWFRTDGSLVSTTDMDPCLGGGDCPTYAATGAYRYALEVPQGDLASVGALDSATFRLVADCS